MIENKNMIENKDIRPLADNDAAQAVGGETSPEASYDINVTYTDANGNYGFQILTVQSGENPETVARNWCAAHGMTYIQWSISSAPNNSYTGSWN